MLNECDISDVYKSNDMNVKEKEHERQRVRRQQTEE